MEGCSVMIDWSKWPLVGNAIARADGNYDWQTMYRGHDTEGAPASDQLHDLLADVRRVERSRCASVCRAIERGNVTSNRTCSAAILAMKDDEQSDATVQDQSILDKVKALAAQQYDLHVGDITADSDIIDDLELDSLDLVEGVLLLEEEFELDIPDEDVEQLRTVGDVVKYVEEKTAK